MISQSVSLGVESHLGLMQMPENTWRETEYSLDILVAKNGVDVKVVIILKY
jgi:hypothetical protein